MTFDGLAGRSIVVTGCAQGIGRAIVLSAAAAEMRVVGMDINAAAGEQTCLLSREAGGDAVFRQCDLSAVRAIAAGFAFAEDILGSIDVLVNNAARVVHVLPEEITEEQWSQMLAVNLTAPAFAAKYAAKSMIATGLGGKIINMSSIAGLAALGRGNFAYSVAKAGLIGMTREQAIEWAGFGIRVNAVAPSQVDTEGFRLLVGNDRIAKGEVLPSAISGIPLGRLAEPSEIVNAVMFLASDNSSFITGETLAVDGGSLALHAGGSMRTSEASAINQ